MKKIDALIQRRAEARQRTAQTCARRIVESAQGNGIEISVIGSLASDRFRLHSDIDLLVHGATDPARRAMIELMVADEMRATDIPYDLIFASDVPADRVQELLRDSV